MDLLKQMTAYDPTAVQKKIRFKRLVRVLKSNLANINAFIRLEIAHQDANARPASPTQSMYDWLCISLDLREASVESRKRRSDLFSESAKGEDSDVEVLEGEEEEEEEISVGAEEDAEATEQND